MTVLNTETRLGMTTGQMPRVNLLPPEIAEQATFRKVQVGLGCALLATVGVVGLLFVSASHSKSAAQTSLDQATTQGSKLQAQTAQYADVTQIYVAADLAKARLATAMGQEVRYSQLLHDLSMSVPSTVWLKQLTYNQVPPAVASSSPAVSTPKRPGAAADVPTTPIGTVSFQGVGFNHDDLALWLESLAALKTYGNVYFSNSTEALMGTRQVVNFSSTADITPAALSGRYNQAGD